MHRKYIISDYSMIRNGHVIRGGNLLFESREGMPAPFFTETYRHFGMNYPRFHKMDNLCKLGFLAAELLLQDKELDRRYPPDGTGIVLYNAASSLDTDRNHQQSIRDRTAYFPSPSVFVYTLPNIVIGEICIRHKIYGEGTFFVEETLDVHRLFSYVRQLLDDDIVKSCITGWLELDGDRYDGVLFLVENAGTDTNGITIFEPGKLTEIYSQRT
jgi:hypothetical protein